VDTPATLPTDRGTLTVSALAQALACNPTAVYGWVMASKIPFTRIGSRTKFDPVAVAD
jgi:hypothetical protein